MEPAGEIQLFHTNKDLIIIDSDNKNVFSHSVIGMNSGVRDWLANSICKGNFRMFYSVGNNSVSLHELQTLPLLLLEFWTCYCKKFVHQVFSQLCLSPRCRSGGPRNYVSPSVCLYIHPSICSPDEVI